MKAWAGRVKTLTVYTTPECLGLHKWPFFVPDDRVSNSLSEKPSDPTGLGYVLIGRLVMAVRIRTGATPFKAPTEIKQVHGVPLGL